MPRKCPKRAHNNVSHARIFNVCYWTVAANKEFIHKADYYHNYICSERALSCVLSARVCTQIHVVVGVVVSKAN